MCSNPLKLLAVFSATAQNFQVKFYIYMTILPVSILNCQAVIFKYDEDSDNDNG